MTSTKTVPQVLSCQELKELLQASSPSVVVLEADAGKQVEADFKAGHIPTAQYFDQLEYTTPTAFMPRGLPDVKSFEDYLTRLGVSNEDHIVLYDRSPAGFFAAGRAWFLLKTYGVDNVSILNGGFHAWVREINEIETSEACHPKKEKKFIVKLNEQMVRYFDQMIANLSLEANSPERVQVVDARPPNLFYIFQKAGVDLSKPAIYTCQGGITASVMAFVAHLLGQKEHPVYMGSFIEWQQRAPADMIIKGDTKPAVS
ncbi:unnamed protein product [Rotaria sordida]|uniref:Rhodanese domain-containing protein n=1 Tax=Rotaria sordida TaxID=392033 RepID=A0A818JQL3_9BILA|nr:unnamed protein product [Rotaria sordida]CAF3747389.1 unnamed protein product [Rotaria sordida]